MLKETGMIFVFLILSIVDYFQSNVIRMHVCAVCVYMHFDKNKLAMLYVVHGVYTYTIHQSNFKLSNLRMSSRGRSVFHEKNPLSLSWFIKMAQFNQSRAFTFPTRVHFGYCILFLHIEISMYKKRTQYQKTRFDHVTISLGAEN